MTGGNLSQVRAPLTLTGVEALTASDDVFRLLAARTPVGIFVASKTGRYEYVNESWCELAGTRRPIGPSARAGWPRCIPRTQTGCSSSWNGRWRREQTAARNTGS